MNKRLALLTLLLVLPFSLFAQETVEQLQDFLVTHNLDNTEYGDYYEFFENGRAIYGGSVGRYDYTYQIHNVFPGKYLLVLTEDVGISTLHIISLTDDASSVVLQRVDIEMGIVDESPYMLTAY